MLLSIAPQCFSGISVPLGFSSAWSRGLTSPYERNILKWEENSQRNKHSKCTCISQFKIICAEFIRLLYISGGKITISVNNLPNSIKWYNSLWPLGLLFCKLLPCLMWPCTQSIVGKSKENTFRLDDINSLRLIQELLSSDTWFLLQLPCVIF